jgi:hypothetical protein
MCWSFGKNYFANYSCEYNSLLKDIFWRSNINRLTNFFAKRFKMIKIFRKMKMRSAFWKLLTGVDHPNDRLFVGEMQWFFQLFINFGTASHVIYFYCGCHRLLFLSVILYKGGGASLVNTSIILLFSVFWSMFFSVSHN